MTDKTGTFSEQEKTAIKERAKELKAEERANAKRADGEKTVLETIAEMPKADREIAEQLHAIITEAAPHLWPKLRYGMPSYAIDGKDVVCFFQAASKYDTAHATFAFDDVAQLKDGTMWPSAFGISELTDADAKTIAALVIKATS